MGLSIGILPSLAIGACAFGAGELVLRGKDSISNKIEQKTMNEVLKDAKSKNIQIKEMIQKVEIIDVTGKTEEQAKKILDRLDVVIKYVNDEKKDNG